MAKPPTPVQGNTPTAAGKGTPGSVPEAGCGHSDGGGSLASPFPRSFRTPFLSLRPRPSSFTRIPAAGHPSVLGYSAWLLSTPLSVVAASMPATMHEAIGRGPFASPRCGVEPCV